MAFHAMLFHDCEMMGLPPRKQVAAESAKSSKDFYAGLQTSLALMLESPQFLFRQDIVEPAPGGGTRLDGGTGRRCAGDMEHVAAAPGRD